MSSPNGSEASHHPKVAGSNPAPAMSLTTSSEPSFGRAFCFSKALAIASVTVAEISIFRAALS